MMKEHEYSQSRTVVRSISQKDWTSTPHHLVMGRDKMLSASITVLLLCEP